METPQINSPQKTSFWDFQHKKKYFNIREKLFDFFIGVCASFAIYMGGSSLAQPIFRSFSPYTLSVLLAFGIKIIILLMAFIYFFLRRRHIFWGLFFGYFAWIFIFKAL